MLAIADTRAGRFLCGLVGPLIDAYTCVLRVSLALLHLSPPSKTKARDDINDMLATKSPCACACACAERRCSPDRANVGGVENRSYHDQTMRCACGCALGCGDEWPHEQLLSAVLAVGSGLHDDGHLVHIHALQAVTVTNALARFEEMGFLATATTVTNFVTTACDRDRDDKDKARATPKTNKTVKKWRLARPEAMGEYLSSLEALRATMVWGEDMMGGGHRGGDSYGSFTTTTLPALDKYVAGYFRTL